MDYFTLNDICSSAILKPVYLEVQFRDSKEKDKVKIIGSSLGSIGNPNSSTILRFSYLNENNKIHKCKFGDLISYLIIEIN